jgi:hypothetical protein
MRVRSLGGVTAISEDRLTVDREELVSRWAPGVLGGSTSAEG